MIIRLTNTSGQEFIRISSQSNNFGVIKLLPLVHIGDPYGLLTTSCDTRIIDQYKNGFYFVKTQQNTIISILAWLHSLIPS